MTAILTSGLVERAPDTLTYAAVADLCCRIGRPPVYLRSINHSAVELDVLTILVSPSRGVSSWIRTALTSFRCV